MIAPRSRLWLLFALAATLLFRFWVAAIAPLTADEAYFILWGRAPDIGFYDHPPMIGWIFAVLAAISDSVWAQRLPAVLVPPLVALGLRSSLLRWFGQDEDAANLAALAVLLVPMNIWNVLVTTDTPLVFFSTISVLAFARAAQRNAAGWFLISGIFLGLAFLSKYFAVLYGLAYLAWAVSFRNSKAFLLVLLGALPFGLLNLYWNVNACWCNVMFNAINRHEDAGLSLKTPLLYAASLAYLAAPILWYGWRERRRLGWEDPVKRALILSWLLPLLLFAALSPVRRIGLHWLLSFLPALILSAALALHRNQLVRSVQILALLALGHVAAIAVAAALPLSAWQSTWIYPRLVFPGRIAELMSAIEPDLRGKILAADSYSAAALFAFHGRRRVPVFGPGTSHSRQDDIDTDWRAYAGMDMLVLRRESPPLHDYQPYFRSVEVKRVPLGGGAYYAIIGRGFNYPAYRAGVLAEVRDRYYRIPAPLPIGRCYFFERYFPR